MLDYYTGIILLTWIVLIVLSILIQENGRIAKEEKRMFYITYILIGCAALSELVGVYLEGYPGLPKQFLLAAKFADYTLTPMAGGAVVEYMYRNSPKERRLLWAFFIGNMIFQVIASFFGWITQIDENNRFSHGPFYFVYVIVYLVVIVLVIYKFIAYGNKFRKKNRLSLYAIIAMVAIGILIQETSNSEIRIAYLVMAIGACLMFIHYSEFSQLKSDDSLSEQHLKLMTDKLTGVRSRYAYSEKISEFNESGELPLNLAVFSIDINGLKEVNDSLGHEAGDELICAAASCIVKVVGKDCYRIGGDEFIVFAQMKPEEAENVLRMLEMETERWSGRLVKKLSLAAGYAMAEDFPECCIEDMIRESDLLMYAAKYDYYKKNGNERRKIVVDPSYIAMGKPIKMKEKIKKASLKYK